MKRSLTGDSRRWVPGGLATLILALLAPLLTAGSAAAAQVTIPLNIDYLTLREALQQQLYTAPGGIALLWNGADPCQYLRASHPTVFSRAGVLEFETGTQLRLGVGLGSDNCVGPVDWSGLVDADLQSYIGSDLVIRFRVTDINLYKTDHQKSLIVDRGFDLIKGNLIPRLESFTFDLRPALDQLQALVRMAAAPDAAARVSAALATLRPVSGIKPEANSLRVDLQLTTPNLPSTLPAVASAPLSPKDLQAWQDTLDNWDAFMVFAIEQLGGTISDPKVRKQLLDLLLDGRFRLVQALSNPQASTGPDPVRIIFLDEWTRLRDIIRAAAQQGLLKDRSLEFLSFISAGDALFALDQAAPALGLHISADDLRHLARVMAPQYTADPLLFNFDENPALQKMFGVSAPLESPGPLILPSESPTATPAASGTLPPSPTSAAPQAHSFLGFPVRFGLVSADAAETPLTSQLFAIGAALSRVVVNPRNARDYKASVQNLLKTTAQYELNQSDPAPGMGQTYFLLINATAWQESCWRQFVERNGQVRFLESSTGDIGLMQVNKHVWRGFYSLPRLEWDVVYNASAGGQILKRLMDNEADRVSSRRPAQLAAISRSVYAAYNGGPAAHDRWRQPNEASDLRAIDHSFWQKYEAVRSGQSFDILDCAAHWGHSSGH